MFRGLHSLLAILWFATASFSQLPDTLWTRLYPVYGVHNLSEVCRTLDSNYVMAGCTQGGGVNFDGVGLKIGSTGDSLWEDITGGPGQDAFYAIAATQDGGCIMAGSTDTTGTAGNDPWLVKFSAGGTVEWQRVYPAAANQIAKSVQQTNDGGYVIAGDYSVAAQQIWDIFVIKTDATGGETWSGRHGGNHHDYANMIRQTSDSGYVVAGSSESDGIAGTAQACIWRLSSNGDSLWTRRVAPFTGPFGSGTAAANDVQQISDGGYISTGRVRMPMDTTWSMYLIRLTESGDTVWTRFYNMASYVEGIRVRETASFGYLIGGTWDRGLPSHKDFYFVWTDSGGDTLETGAFGTWNVDELTDMLETENDGLLAVGSSRPIDSGIGSGFVMALGVSGVEGTVHDSLSGMPVEGVRVSAQGSTLSAVTNSEGHYDLRLHPGTYNLVVSGACTGRDTVRNETVPLSPLVHMDWVVARPHYQLPQSSVNMTVHNHLPQTVPFKIISTGPGILDYRIEAETTSPRTDWLSVAPQSGTVAVGDTATIMITVHADTSDNGTYDFIGRLNLHGNSCPDTLRYIAVSATVLAADDRPDFAPRSFSFGAAPNPFNPTTTVSFVLPRTDHVRISVFDVTGREVAVIADEGFEAGSHNLTFDAGGLSSGVYFAHFSSANYVRTAKLMLLR